MDFSLIQPDKLKVTLTRVDLAELGIEYDKLDYKDENTRRVLITLLDKGRGRAGFNPQLSKLYIEVYPREDGGCVIYYTRLAGGEVFPAGRFVPGPNPVVFAFSDADTLLDACARTLQRYGHRIYKSSLYDMGGQYRLVVYPLDYADPLSIYFLSEYGRSVGEGAVLAAYAEEHGKELARDNAIELLARIAGIHE